MAKRQRQQSLLSVWSGKRIRSEGNEDNYGSPASEIQNLSGEQQLNLHDNELHDQVDDINVSTTYNLPNDNEEIPNTESHGFSDSIIHDGGKEDSNTCTAECCFSFEKPFQPSDKHILDTPATDKRKFQSQWYKQFHWHTICVTVGKAFCLYCRIAVKHKLLTFSKMGEKAFTESGFQNWKKAIEKFKLHEGSHAHREAVSKWMACGRQTIAAQLNSQLQQSQKIPRQGLLAQIKGIRYLAHQGIAFHNHKESEGNLHQLFLTWSEDNDDIKSWIHENRFTCHQSVGNLITIARQSILRKLLLKIKDGLGPAWFSVIADEATDVASNEQMSVAICWVSDSYDIQEHPVGLFKVPNTTTETLFTIIKEILI